MFVLGDIWSSLENMQRKKTGTGKKQNMIVATSAIIYSSILNSQSSRKGFQTGSCSYFRHVRLHDNRFRLNGFRELYRAGHCHLIDHAATYSLMFSKFKIVVAW